MSIKQKEEHSSDTLHALQDRQGKIFLASRKEFGWLTLEGTPISSYGYRDLGQVLQAYNKLAQYQHAARIFLGSQVTGINNVASLFREIEK